MLTWLLYCPKTFEPGRRRRSAHIKKVGGAQMAIVRWEPARELASMEVDRLNRMFSDLYGEAFSRSAWVPPVDIYETDEHEVVLKAELPEVKRENISVTFENGVLTLKGERQFEEETR